jgi:trans-aconitate 2-methyltransferase
MIFFALPSFGGQESQKCRIKGRVTKSRRECLQNVAVRLLWLQRSAIPWILLGGPESFPALKAGVVILLQLCRGRKILRMYEEKMNNWNPLAYGRFDAERNRPSIDLLARVPQGPRRRIVDLGCGAGLSTQALADRYPDSDLVGVDTSTQMLAAARARLPDVRFLEGDAANWKGRADLVFANALFHWVPDHIGVMTRMVVDLEPGGCLAAQMPDNEDESTHVLMRMIGAALPFRAKLAGASAAREKIGALGDYDAALSPFCDLVDIWRTVYLHRLDGPAAIVAWVAGAGLRPHLAPLAADEREEYLSRYLEAITAAYPRQAWGGVLMPFPRLFVVVRRA